MSIYHQGRKVSEVWHQGRKVKEVWYGSKKIYSVIPEWELGKMYNVTDVVQVDGTSYVCTYRHQARDYYRPKTGKWWSDYWKQGTKI